MPNDDPLRMKRRGFLGALGAAGIAPSAASAVPKPDAPIPGSDQLSPVTYPRVFTGKQLSQIAFPLGGIGTGSISLGGRGQLQDWEIFNRPDKGQAPEYAFASIYVQSGRSKPQARVLEARLMPPYKSTAGLGPAGAPGLSRLRSAKFTGEFPLARLDFIEPQLPVKVSLEAFSPFIPLDAENSGFPAAILRYRVRNPQPRSATVSIAFSLENPVGMQRLNPTRRMSGNQRVNEFRSADGLQGFFMTNPGLEGDNPLRGSFTMALLQPGAGKVTYLSGWPNAKWWASPLLFWDDFSSDGELGPEAPERKPYASLCLKCEIAAGAEAEYTFLLSWHFPNRTPAWSGWEAPKGHENAILGNHYCQRFADAWAAAAQVAAQLPELERRTRGFAETIRNSTLPAAVRDAATANASTLVTQTCFRTADGEFHAFEGSSDHAGCCFGNCTHVWNYETTTQYLFPSLAQSLRRHAFGFSQDEQGGMRHRQLLPDKIQRYPYAAADGQMGQIIKAYMDWRLSGDTEHLRSLWPAIQRGISFAWIPGGWDRDRTGVMDGVQHNTYDVEFYGPNPLTGIYYLGALRAAEEIAHALGATAEAREYRRLFDAGSRWTDANLFNGEYYYQKIRPIPKEQIAPTTVSGMGSDRPDHPEFQLGDGCLADQLIGQYLADLAGLGPLVSRGNIDKTLAAIYKYNFRADLMQHDSVQRVYALNDEPALLVCDYGRGARSKIPFPYYAEAWTGIEYLVAAQMITAGMLDQGLRCVDSARRRFDGERRNPWDEPECGHHYARAMSAWSVLVALSGFDYHAGERALTARPRTPGRPFRSFWSAAAGWGSFAYTADRFIFSVVEGRLPVRSVALQAGSKISAKLGPDPIAAELKPDRTLVFSREIIVSPRRDLTVLLSR